jgi:hypothetical protein
MQLQEVNLNLATHLISNIAIRILKETNIVQLVEDGKTTATEAEVEEVQAAVVVVATTITEILRNVINIQSHLNLDGIFFTNFVR